MKNSFDKLTLAAAIALAIPLLSSAAWAQTTDNDGCADDSLNGDYAFTISEQVFGPTTIQRDGVAMTHFDGNGNLTQVDFVLANGVPVPGPEDPTTHFHVGEFGTYTVNPDCTGNATINFPPPPGSPGAIIKLMFVIGDSGRVLHTIVSSLTPPGAKAPVAASIHSDAVKLGGQ
jgi:hypothetical protein